MQFFPVATARRIASTEGSLATRMPDTVSSSPPVMMPSYMASLCRSPSIEWILLTSSQHVIVGNIKPSPFLKSCLKSCPERFCIDRRNKSTVQESRHVWTIYLHPERYQVHGLSCQCIITLISVICQRRVDLPQTSSSSATQGKRMEFRRQSSHARFPFINFRSHHVQKKPRFQYLAFPVIGLDPGVAHLHCSNLLKCVANSRWSDPRK